MTINLQLDYINMVRKQEQIGYSRTNTQKDKLNQYTSEIQDIASLIQAINNQKAKPENQKKAENDIVINLNSSPENIALVKKVKASLSENNNINDAIHESCVWKGTEIANVLSTLQKSSQFKSDEIKLILPELEQTLKTLNILIELAAQGEKGAERHIQNILDNIRKAS